MSPVGDGTDNKEYFAGAELLEVVCVLWAILAGLVAAAGRVRASRVLHEELIKSVLRA